MKVSFKQMTRQRSWLIGALATVMVTFAGAAGVMFYPQRPAVEVRYDRMASEVMIFHVENRSDLPILLGIEKFVVSTLKLRTIGFDRFEVQFANNSAVVAGTGSTSIAIPVPSGAQPYLCSQLRSIGFFLNYGQLRNGRLREPLSPERTKQMADDLRCSFAISETSTAAKNPAEYEFGVACDKVAWINACVATVIWSAN